MKPIYYIPLVIFASVAFAADAAPQKVPDLTVKLIAANQRIYQLELAVVALDARLKQIEQQNKAEVVNRPVGIKYSPDGWLRLQKKLSQDQVEKLLGTPRKTSAGGSLIYWYYSASELDAKVIFSADDLTVWGWDPPR